MSTDRENQAEATTVGQSALIEPLGQTKGHYGHEDGCDCPVCEDINRRMSETYKFVCFNCGVAFEIPKFMGPLTLPPEACKKTECKEARAKAVRKFTGVA